MTTTRAAVYARISSDAEGTGLGVQRQLDDCQREADRRGWTVVGRYVDNDVSATRAKVRPEYRRMIAAVEAGALDAVVVWDVDRLTRQPRELEDVIDLADRYKLQLASVGGEIDLATPQGRMTARIKGTVARHEAEQMSRRIRRKFAENAAAGRPHAHVPFGFTRVDVTNDDGRVVGRKDVVDEPAATIVREAAQRVLSGESLRSVCKDFNARGLPTPGGATWQATTLRQVLLRPSTAGLRRHQGHVIGESNGEAVLDRDTWDRLVATLKDPTRRVGIGRAPVHLLSGIALCGRCGAVLFRQRGARKRTGEIGPAAYACRSCFRLRRRQSAVDEVVEAAVKARLRQPDIVARYARGNPREAEDARRTVETLEARLALAADQFADGAITGPQLKRITAKITPQIEDARQVVARSAGNSLLGGLLAAPDPAAAFDSLGIEVKRAVIEALMTVTVLPVGTGVRFSPEQVQIDWREPS